MIWKMVLKKLNRNRAFGPDCIKAELFKVAAPELKNELLKVFVIYGIKNARPLKERRFDFCLP